MPTTYTAFVLRSGNHGRENNSNQSSVEETITNGGKPRLSSAKFVAPTSIASKKTSSIKDVVNDPPLPQTPIINPTDEKNIIPPTEVEDVQVEIKSMASDEIPEVSEKLPISDKFEEKKEEKVEEKLEEKEIEETKESAENNEKLTLFWNEMLYSIFEDVPAIRFPLKDHPPTFEENIVYVRVNSNFLQDHFDRKKREVLAYFRQYYDSTIEDISVVIDTQIESKKIIYDNKDKLDYLRNQNPQMTSFIDILKLTIKD